MLMEMWHVKSEMQDLALCGFGECFKPLSVSKLLNRSVFTFFGS